jgi:hypothetical protein
MMQTENGTGSYIAEKEVYRDKHYGRLIKARELRYARQQKRIKFMPVGGGTFYHKPAWLDEYLESKVVSPEVL